MTDYVVVKEWYKSPEVGGVLSFDVVPDALKANVLPVGFKPYDQCETKCGDSEGLEAELKELRKKLDSAEADLRVCTMEREGLVEATNVLNDRIKKYEGDLKKANAEIKTLKESLAECEAGKE